MDDEDFFEEEADEDQEISEEEVTIVLEKMVQDGLLEKIVNEDGEVLYQKTSLGEKIAYQMHNTDLKKLN